MTASERSAARYARLKAEGRCVQCRDRLSGAHEKIRCDRCYGVSKRGCTGGKLAEKSRNLDAEVAYIVETAETLNPVEQAAELGIAVDRVYGLRAIARRRGFKLSNLWTPRAQYAESRKWTDLAKSMATTCERCGLRGPHQCIQRVEAYLNSGPGRTYPAPGGCGITRAERTKMRTPPKNYVYGRGAGKPTPPVVP